MTMRVVPIMAIAPGCGGSALPIADYTNLAGLVDKYGYVVDYYVYTVWAARPAFNLDLNSVLFTSAAEGGKSASGMDSGLTAVGDYDRQRVEADAVRQQPQSFMSSNATKPPAASPAIPLRSITPGATDRNK